MSITRGIEILINTPSNQEELCSIKSNSSPDNEWFGWKNRVVDVWISEFLFSESRRDHREVSISGKDMFFYIIPKGVIEEMAQAIKEKDFGEDCYLGAWEDEFEERELLTLNFLAEWIQKQLDAMSDSQCFCYYDCGE